MEHLGFKIRKIHQLIKLHMNHNLKQLDITVSQMHVLTYLFRYGDEKITQKILSEEFGVKHSTMSGILARLKEKGFIDIRVDEQNKKYRNIYLTSKARRLKEQMNANREKTESLLIKDFTDKEIEQLCNYLDRLYHNLLTDSEISDKVMECFNEERTIERRQKYD